jgi:hypothetical protein
MIDPNELKKELKNFCGSEVLYQYSFLWINFYYSEGCRFVFESAKSYWLLNLIASWQDSILDVDKAFQTWELKKISDKNWVIKCTDGNKRELCRQELSYSDFPLDHIKLWLVNGVLMLPTEY